MVFRDTKSSLQVSLRSFFILLLLVAAFLGGWVAKTNYDRWNRPQAGIATPRTIQHVGPTVDAVTLRTRNDLAAISVGSDDGVRLGMSFHFYRNDKIMGRGKVVKVNSNMSAVQLLDANGTGKKVEEGDIAQLRY